MYKNMFVSKRCNEKYQEILF